MRDLFDVLFPRYFQHLADDFEVQMQLYRQQIVEMEKYLESADKAASLSPHGGCTLVDMFVMLLSSRFDHFYAKLLR